MIYYSNHFILLIIFIMNLSILDCLNSQNFTMIYEENQSALNYCNTKQKDLKIRNENFCLYNVTIDKPEVQYYLTNDFGIKECCFMREINDKINLKNGFCNYTNIINNGTIIKKNNKEYETICIPFNYKQYMDEQLNNYNEPLVPCGENDIIETSNDCFYYGNDEKFCCHVYGNIEGIKVNQCYYFNRAISSRSGIFDSKVLKFVCKCNLLMTIDFFVYMFLFILLNNLL